MPTPLGIRRHGRPGVVLRSRLRDLTSFMRSNPALQRMGKWLDNLQTDLRGAATERLHEAGTLANRVARQLLGPAHCGPRAVVNATGMLVLERAGLPLADAAIDEMSLVARDYRSFARNPAAACPTGLRSVEALVCELTGAEAALVFANPAGAMTAVLSALARGREAIVSRAHVERLQGDFLLPDAARLAQAQLREVGATHRTSAADYSAACSAATGAILHCQPGEYALAGAVDLAPLDELVELAAGRRIPLVASLPSAGLVALPYPGVTRLPLVGESIVAGADLVLFRGDTCLGGPASAIIAGRRELVEQIAADPLAPIFAADPFTLAGLAATLRLCAAPQQAVRLDSAGATVGRVERQPETSGRAAGSAAAAIVAGGPGRGDARRGLAERSPAARRAAARLVLADHAPRHERPAPGRRPGRSFARRLAQLADSADGDHLLLNLRSVLARQDEQIVAAFQALGPRAADAAATDPATASASTDVLDSAE